MFKNISNEKLGELIDEATVDCNDEEEQSMGFFSAIDDALIIPFKAKVIGVDIEVTSIEQNNTYYIDAICERNGKQYKINILNLEYDPKQVKGYEWLEAFRKWISTF